MKRALFILSVFAAFLLYPSLSRSEEAQNKLNELRFISLTETRLPPFVAAAAKGIAPDSNKSLVLLNLENNSLTLKTQYLEKFDDKPRFLAMPANPQEQFGLLATSTLVERHLTAEGEVAYSSPAPAVPRSQSLFDFGENQNRLLRFGVKGTLADFGYGAEYRSVGRDFVNLANAPVARDQDGAEVWLQKSFGIFGFKLSGSDFSNNVARDPTLPQINRLQGGASASISPPSWPVLSVFYYKGLQRSSNEPAGFDPQNGAFDSFGASLQYKGSRWDGMLATTFSVSDIASRLGKVQNAAGRLYADYSHLKTMTPGVSFGFNYYPSLLPVQLTAFGAYSKTTTSDKYTNSDVLNLGAVLNWKFGGPGPAKSTLSVGGGFNAYLDNVNAYNSNHDVSVWTRLKVPVF
jgi:hypothetical protein